MRVSGAAAAAFAPRRLPMAGSVGGVLDGILPGNLPGGPPLAAAAAPSAASSHPLPATSTSSTLPPPQPPTGPSALHPPVLKRDVRIRDGGVPPPMPAAPCVAFPSAKHRSERRYVPGQGRRAAATTRPPAASPAEQLDAAAAAKPAASEGGATLDLTTSKDPMADKALEQEMLEDGSLVAAAAVLLRSRSAAERSQCIQRLLGLGGAGLRRAVSESGETVAAQFVLALRLATDAATPAQQADAVRIVERLTDRAGETRWFALLELVQWNGLATPLASWLEEKTLFGLGVCKLSQPVDPVQDVPTARLWDAAESVHELSSLARCDLFECLAKAQFGTRLRYLLANPDDATPWVPHAALAILRNLSLSRACAEALAAAPRFIETLVGIASAEAVVLEEPSAARLSTAALLVLNNLCKCSDEVAEIIKEVGGWQRAVAVVQTTVESRLSVGPLDAVALAHAKAALRLVRSGLFLRKVSKHCVTELFSALTALVREGCTEALGVLDAHGTVYSFSEVCEGQQVVGLIDFAVRDLRGQVCDARFAARLAGRGGGGDGDGDASEAAVFASLALNVMCHAVDVAPATAGAAADFEALFEALHKRLVPAALAALPTGDSFSLLLTPFADLYRQEGGGGGGGEEGKQREGEEGAGAVEEEMAANATRWPPLRALEGRVCGAAVHSALLKLHTSALEARATLPSVYAAVRPRLAALLLDGDSGYCAALRAAAPAEKLTGACLAHSFLTKQHSRVHAAAVRPIVELAVLSLDSAVRYLQPEVAPPPAAAPAARRVTFGVGGGDADAPAPAAAPSTPAVCADAATAAYAHSACLNLSLFVQPCDGMLFRLMLSVLMPDHASPALAEYFTGAFRLRPETADGLYLSYKPGRLEPQVEWVFLPAVDASNDGADARMLTVTTRAHAVDARVLAEWGAWLAAAYSADEATYLTELDWREAVLRAAAVLASAEGGAADSLSAFLDAVVRRKKRADAAAEAALRATAAAGTVAETAAAAAVASMSAFFKAEAWRERFGEAPLQIVMRLLHGYEHEHACGDAVFSAIVLMLLTEDFPLDIRRAVLACVCVPQLCALAGTCFGAGSPCTGMYLGLRRYLGTEEVDNDEQARELCMTLSPRASSAVNSANLLHIYCVHKLSQYLFEQEEDGAWSLSFTAPDLLPCLSASALRCVAAYRRPSAAELQALSGEAGEELAGFLRSRCASESDEEKAGFQKRVAAIKELGCLQRKVLTEAFP